MDSRTRFQRTMAHLPVDRPPFDIGGTDLTFMNDRCQQQLLQTLGLGSDESEKTGGIDARLLEWSGTDFRKVGATIDLPGSNAKRRSDTDFTDSWGIRHVLRDGHWQMVDPPLKNAGCRELRSYTWPEARIDDEELARYVAAAQELHAANEYVVVATHPVLGVLELGCWLCGYDTFLMKLLGEPDFVTTFADIILGIQLQVTEQYYKALGPYIDVTTSGDDFGMQTGPLLSPDLFDRTVKPYFAERIRRTKELGQCYYFHHSCGSIVPLIPSLIDCGVDILNPIQTSAAQMDPVQLKAQFGRDLVFWGAVDVQQFLRTAAPEEVREGVRRLCRVLGADGGYVMAPGHNIQEDVPPENIVAWVETMGSINE